MSFIRANAAIPDTANTEVPVVQWLTAGPFEAALPAFHQEKNLEGEVYEDVDLLSSELKTVEQPFEDEVFLWQQNKAVSWKKEKTGKKGVLKIPEPKKADFALNWQAVYLQNESYSTLTFEIESPQCFLLFVDGEKELSKLRFSEKGKDVAKKKKELELEPGKHLIVIVSLFSKGEETEWKVQTKFRAGAGESISLSLNPKHFMDMKLLLDGLRLKDASLSPDAKYVMLRYSETFPPKGKSENWFEIQHRQNGQIIFSSRGRKMHQVKWVPVGHQISYATEVAGKNTLEILDLDRLSSKVLLQSKKNFNDHRWAKDASFLIYSMTEKPKEKQQGVYKVEGMPDRWPWWRMRTQLYQLTIEDLTTRRLTFGYLGNNLHDISPDGKSILISHDFPDFSERPYSKQILMELHLSDLSVDTIWEKNYGGSAIYSPNGKKLLVTGSPVLFGDAGNVVGNGKTPNDYDNQAYIYDLNPGSVEAISRNFNPSIGQVWWNSGNGLIYCIGQDRTYKKAYVFNPETRTFSDLNAKVDVVKNMSFSSTRQMMVYTGNSISSPAVCYDYNLQSKLQNELANPEGDALKYVQFGLTEDWDFENENGETIEGRVYYPPDFDPEKKYPLIVYYYGGTSPTDRSFRGRYPKNLFAAMGFVVFVPQPSGATGYGQEFSALHVNNWGITVADEIISGTQLFLKAHDFVDPEKVGCIGASYGGFMTMLLTTRTNIFAAAISHAGISSISSYWGEGYWGYLYSSVASANSFPWNNPELYTGQSPLFHADKVTTPLLLLHGDADTNVPPGESIQMYTALKLLGKTVELVEVQKQNHHITDYNKRLKWQKTILAWFDKWLKNDSSWWDALYPEKNL
ncbi:MAG: S9 family peptidase [Bacteroidales bacterium]|nr:S9 family peptidase [Bacteroidales bacterium]